MENLRKHILWILAILTGAIIYTSVAWADLYKWVDDKGTVHFSDVPPEVRNTNQPVDTIPSAPPSKWHPTPTPEHNSRTSAVQATPSPSQPSEVQPGPPKVELYVTSWCKYCKKARNFFLSRNLPFIEYDVEKDPQAAKRRKAIDGRSGVPLAVINGYAIIGYSEKNYEKALKAGR